MTPPVFTASNDVLTLHRRDTRRSTRMIATGEIDSCTAAGLAAALEAALGEEGRAVTVDLDAILFLDAAGVHALAAAAQRAAAVGVRLRLIASRPVVIRLLTMAGLRSLLQTGAMAEAHQAA